MNRWLFDQAMEFGVVTPCDPANPNHDLIDPDAVIVDVSAAAEFWLERCEPGISWSALPTFRPGAERVFLETAAPAAESGVWPAGARWGLAVRASDLEEGVTTLADALVAFHQFERLRPGATLSTAIVDARWVLELHLIGEDGPRRPPKLVASGVLVVRPDGSLARVVNADPDESPVAARIASAPAADRSADRSAGHAAIVAGVLGALLFAHACLQAETEFGRETILPSPAWERRRAARHAVLRIDALLARLRAAGADEPGGLMRALDRERGLFQPAETQPPRPSPPGGGARLPRRVCDNLIG